MPRFAFVLRYADASTGIKEQEAIQRILKTNSKVIMISSVAHFDNAPKRTALSTDRSISFNPAEVEQPDNAHFLLQFYATFADQLPVDSELKELVRYNLI